MTKNKNEKKSTGLYSKSVLKSLKLPYYDMEVFSDGSVTSNLREQIDISDDDYDICSSEDICYTEEVYESFCDSLELFIFNCSMFGVDIKSESFAKAVERTVEEKCMERLELP